MPLPGLTTVPGPVVPVPVEPLPVAPGSAPDAPPDASKAEVVAGTHETCPLAMPTLLSSRRGSTDSKMTGLQKNELG